MNHSVVHSTAASGVLRPDKPRPALQVHPEYELLQLVWRGELYQSQP